MNEGPHVILGIETAVGSGSLALYDGVEMLRSEGVVSRSETLLPRIHELLSSSSYCLEDLDHLSVSLGPGSFTGIRIGIATAIGLASGIGIECTGLSALDAVESEEEVVRGYAIVPLGRSQFAVRFFDNVSKSAELRKIEVASAEELLDRVRSLPDVMFLMPSEFSSMDPSVVESVAAFPNLVVCSESTAGKLCRLAARGLGTSDLTPYYLRREN